MINDKQNKKIYEQGYAAFEPGVDPYKVIPFKPRGNFFPDEATHWFRGWSDAEYDRGVKLLPYFLVDLDKLCRKYNVKLRCHGCGECEGSIYVSEIYKNKEVIYGPYGGDFGVE